MLNKLDGDVTILNGTLLGFIFNESQKYVHNFFSPL